MTVGELRDYKDALYNSLSRELSDFEKNFLLISSGILAFSIAFIKDIVSIKDASILPSLFVAWILFVISIGMMMFTFIWSAKVSDKLWFLVDKFLIDNKKFNKEDDLTEVEASTIKSQTNNLLNKEKSGLKNMRYGAIWSFLFGLISLGIFVGSNIMKEHNGGALDKNYIIKIDKKSNGIFLENLKIDYSDSLIIIRRNSK